MPGTVIISLIYLIILIKMKSSRFHSKTGLTIHRVAHVGSCCLFFFFWLPSSCGKHPILYASFRMFFSCSVKVLVKRTVNDSTFCSVKSLIPLNFICFPMSHSPHSSLITIKKKKSLFLTCSFLALWNFVWLIT